MSTTHLPIDAQQRREIAARAACDDRSVTRAYRGEPLRAGAYHRIRRAAAELGLPEPPAQSPPTAPTGHSAAAHE